MREETMLKWDLQLFAGDGAPAGEGGREAAGDKPADAGQERDEGTAGAAADFDEALRDPEFNRKVQDIVSKRVAAYRGRLAELEPVLETIGKRYGMDTDDLSKLDLAELKRRMAEEDAPSGGSGEATAEAEQAAGNAEPRFSEGLLRQAEMLSERLQ